MITTVNPGSRLELVARLGIDHVVSHEPEGDLSTVFDLDSLDEVSLVNLLRSFRQDPSDDVIGFVRITIEPCEPHADHALHNVRVAS